MGLIIFIGILFGIRGSGLLEMGAMSSSLDMYYPKDNSTYVGSREWEAKKGDWTF